MKYWAVAALVLHLFLIATVATAAAPGNVDAARLAATDAEPGNWFTGGRDRDGTYYSPLATINAGNIDRLGFAWDYDLRTARGQEATPIVVDGVIYTSGIWGHVFALDAKTGKEIWHYDPEVPGEWAKNACCDIVNRGVAVWQGKVYVASLDGRLHALDAATGRKLWEVDTIVDHGKPYASTGAVAIAGKVAVIGNGGADLGKGGVRGYVSAYDLETGALTWRFYTVPPAPGQPLESPDLAVAAQSWDPKRAAKYQGGATVWDGFAYDPQLNLVYFGTGNAAPYDQRQRSSSNTDDLFSAALVAVDATTGRMAWYFQETPGDRWDYDAVQKLILAELPIDGTPRQVVMQASKNGFFYVLDRKTGALLSAKDYTFVNWTSGLDPKTGRPTVAEAANYYTGPKNIYPSWAGGHTWNPMSYDAKTGLVYIPVIDAPNVMFDLTATGGALKFLEGFFTVGGFIPDDTYDAAAMKRVYGDLPDLATLRAGRKEKLVRELLRAWDPVARKTVWEQVTSEDIRGYDGGVISTAGNLVFQGRGDGGLYVYAADTGKLLKVVETGSHIMAAPSTYAVDGEQYVAVQVGYGGAGYTVGTIPPSSAAFKYENRNRLIAFKLDGGPVPKPPLRRDPPISEPPPDTAPRDLIQEGEVKFAEQCSRCHSFGPNITPDLRNLPPEIHANIKDVVLGGALSPLGMPHFEDVLTAHDVDAIDAYLIDEGWKAYRDQQAAPAKPTDAK